MSKIFNRMEKKFLISLTQKEQLLSEFLKYLSFDPYCMDGNHYHIFNMYFDNINNDVIRFSTSKPIFKEKLRLRGYGYQPSNDSLCFFEIKKKFKGIVNKRRISVYYNDYLNYINHQKKFELKNMIDQQILNEIEYLIKSMDLYPKIQIDYDRIALYHPSSDLRITFDFNITCNQEDKFNLIEDDAFIMEIKTNGTVPDWLTQLLIKYELYHKSFSKYGRVFQNYSSYLFLN